MRLYHLSYDAINCKKDFAGNYDEARRYLLCVIVNTPVIEIHSYNESSLIIHYEAIQPKLFSYLTRHLNSYFHYSVSLVATNENGHFISHNKNNELDASLQLELKLLTCNNFGDKRIAQY